MAQLQLLRKGQAITAQQQTGLVSEKTESENKQMDLGMLMNKE